MIRFKLFTLVCFLITFINGSTIVEAQTLNQSVSQPAGVVNKINQDEILNIGLLIPDKKALAAKQGAELAIRRANEKGGYSGHLFHLAVRSTAGPWGAGSKESVNLVFEDKVLAIMGSLDGRNAHLAEQVATKTRIVFLSSWATDMTLSRAFVPWYFRCVPNDKQQAIVLIREIYKKRKINNVAIIGTADYDSRNAVSTYVKVAESMDIAIPKQFLYKSSGQNSQKILTDIKKYGTEAIILFGKPALALDIIPLLRNQNMKQPVFGSLSIIDNQKALNPDWNIIEGITMVSSGHWFTEKGIAFQKEFQEIYGYQPGPVAAYAYDGINVIIEVIKKAGPDRDKIIDAFSKINYKTGITGEIQFDKNGNRSGNAGLMLIKNGVPIAIEKDH